MGVCCAAATDRPAAPHLTRLPAIYIYATKLSYVTQIAASQTYCLDRAEEIQTIAGSLGNPHARLMMFEPAEIAGIRCFAGLARDPIYALRG